MGLRNALRLFRASANAVPDGAYRPSMTMWYDPAGVAPPVSWVPQSGVFETHWDWNLASALAIPGVWQARRLISQSIGGMPIGVWDDTVELALPAVLRQPNPPEDRCATVAAWVTDLLDHGNAVGIIDHQPTRAADTIWPLPATAVSVSDDGRSYAYGNQRFDRSVVFHVKGVSRPGQHWGIGVLEAGLGAVTRMTAEAAYASRAFTSGVPSGLLRVRDPDLQPGTDDDPAGYATAKGIKKAWMENIAAGDVAVLSELVDFTPLAWNPTDAQMIEARQMSLVDVANMYGLDPFWVGSSQVSAPYQNVQDAAIQLSRFTLGYWITALEAGLSKLLPEGQAKFNRDTILRDTQAQRIDNKNKMIQAGWYTPDEARADEGLPPLPQPQPPASVTPLFPGGDAATNEAVNQ